MPMVNKATIWTWDDADYDIDRCMNTIDIPKTATDKELEEAVRAAYLAGKDASQDDEDRWTLTNIVRGKITATLEWETESGRAAATFVTWTYCGWSPDY